MFDINELEGRVELDAAGLVALADLKTIQNRTALTGSASVSDMLLLAPGIHCHQSAEEVNGGEYPVTGQLNGGHYVFRVENQATVFWLQRVGETGKLVEVEVSQPLTRKPGLRHGFTREAILPSILYFLGCSGSVTIIALLGAAHDFWGMGVLLMLVVARIINVVVIRRRSQQGWKGAIVDDDVPSDLLIILSQDRWVRMRGLENDVKAVTAGCWLRDMTGPERYATSFATVLVYASAALASNATTLGSLMVALLLLVSAGLLGIANSYTHSLHMFGRIVSVVGEPKAYSRRRLMVDELVAETGSDDWAVNMDLIPRHIDPPKATFTPAPQLQTPPATLALHKRPGTTRSSSDEKGSYDDGEIQQPKLDV
ncbi:hypothetical protein PHLGIDRAFT_127552 [Phlebiopsis gigantea 11061_1 CR5-6]|uniref:Uncharacterized protein n=1 Tax=Phlebiopsis gigantea (strain 11061_1 CR5-6) TaxID=745531 RepID=A0A0C3NQZ0_PHLG1|nr:hypothetical protein PHLGIDRAFT_127552 [Phlebiopsis gigantea 11061_1 CR5-6]